jgi:hypothetical protein
VTDRVDLDTIRRAAVLMREQHGLEHVRHEMWAAMGDLLDGIADDKRGFGHEEALAVARAYLKVTD